MTKYTIGPDVDLEKEEIYLKDGTRLTQEVADDIVEEVHHKLGRPSLTGKPVSSPRVSFRVQPAVRERAAAIAEAEGKTVSQLAREALEKRIGA